MRNPNIKCVCANCGRVWTKKLEVSISILDRDDLRALKNGLCSDCRNRIEMLLSGGIEFNEQPT